MLGKILKLDNNDLYVSLNFDAKNVQNLVNLYVLITDSLSKFVGEITAIDNNIAKINLIGEFTNGSLVYGIIKKPALSAKVDLIAKDSISSLISYEESNNSLKIALSPFYDNVNISANINNFFGSHLAIFGSTGSGKSCSFARIIQNLMSKNGITDKMNFIIFDAYGEYSNAFSYLNNEGKYRFKTYTTDTQNSTQRICLPPWFLNTDDYALLLGVTKKSQIPIIEKALRNVSLFNKQDEQSTKYKNSIIASALLDILLSGRPASQIRDQIISALSKFNTEQINLESKIVTPGYTRTLRQCLLIDDHNKINAIELVTSFFESFIDNNDFKITMPDGSYPFSLKDLENALDFALIDEGIWKSDKIFDDANILKVRLHSLIDSDNYKFFDYNEYISKEDYINNLFISNNQKCQIINFNINYIDDRFAKVIVKIYSKLLFDYSKKLANRASNPYNICLEEAHRYVQNDDDNEILGYNIFERISKEGRKYGVLLTLISQRPCELSQTCTSQCSNFLLFKMSHSADLEFIKQTVPFANEELLNKIKILKPGYGMCFGSAFKIPSLCKVQMPSPMPSSDNCQISSLWFN